MEEKMSKKILGLIGFAVLFSLSACLEGILGTDEEEKTTTDTTLVGTWYGYTKTMDDVTVAAAMTCIFNEDGSGFYKGYHSMTQTDPDSGNFTWETADNKLKSTFDDETYNSDYTITNGVLTLSYTEDGHSIVEKYVKYRGDHPTEMTGKWIQVRKIISDVYDPGLMTAILNNDGSGISYEVSSASDTSVEEFNFQWSTNGNYMIILSANNNGLAEVNQLMISGFIVTVNRYNSDGSTVVSTLVKDTNERDYLLFGNWNLTSAVLNGSSLPYTGTASFANDGNGIITISGISLNFSWFSNSGWLFVYTPATPQISVSRAYVISGNTLTLTLSSEGSGGTENILVLTFTTA